MAIKINNVRNSQYCVELGYSGSCQFGFNDKDFGYSGVSLNETGVSLLTVYEVLLLYVIGLAWNLCFEPQPY